MKSALLLAEKSILILVILHNPSHSKEGRMLQNSKTLSFPSIRILLSRQ